MMHIAQDTRIDAVRAFRRRTIGLERDEGPRLRAVFVACSECVTGAALIASLKPEQLILTPGGTTADLREHAAFGAWRGDTGTRQVVLVGHSRCSFPGWRASTPELVGGLGPKDAARLHLWLELQAFRSRDGGHTPVHALFLEEDDGEVFVLVEDPSPRFMLASDPDCERFFGLLSGRPETTPRP